MFHLVVIHPFGDYKRGDHITDPAKVKEILEGTEVDGVTTPHDNVHHVVKKSAPDAA